MWIVGKGGELLNAESFDEIQIGTDDWQNNEELKVPPAEKKIWFLYAVRLNPYKHVPLTEINLTRSEAETGLKRIRESLACEKPLCDPLDDSIEKALKEFFKESDK